MKFGARFAMPRRVTALEVQENGDFCAIFENGQRIRAGAIVVASGVQYRRLPLERLVDFEGSGVYYSATDMEARYCKDTEVVIIGGGILPVKPQCSSAATPGASECWYEVPRSRPRCRAILAVG